MTTLTSNYQKRFARGKLPYLGLGETNLTGDIVDLNFAVGLDDSGKIKLSAGVSVNQNDGPKEIKLPAQIVLQHVAVQSGEVFGHNHVILQLDLRREVVCCCIHLDKLVSQETS